MRVHPEAPVIAVDIDGTLAAYHDHFCEMAAKYLGRPSLTPQWWKLTGDARGEFSDALSEYMDKTTYRQIKLAFRQGGWKRFMPALDDKVSENLQYIRSFGVQVWVCTTRPWMRLDSIDPDTQFWIERNVGRIDGLVYGEEKYEDLVDLVGKDRILGVFDDLPENIMAARRLGLRTALRFGEHNRYWRRSAEALGVPIFSHSNNIAGWTEYWKEESAA